MPLAVAVTFLYFAGVAIVYPALPFQALELGASAPLVTLLLVVEPLIAALLAPWIGRLSDRLGRRPVALVLMALAVPAYLIMAAAGSLWLLFASRILAGASSAVSPVIQAHLADITTADERVSGMAGINAAYCLAFIVGPMIAMLSLGPSGSDYATTALIATGVAAVAAAAVAFLATPTEAPAAARDDEIIAATAGRPARPASASARPFAAAFDPRCAILVAVLVAFGLVYASLDTTLGLWLDRAHGWGARELSVAFAIAGTAAFVALCFIRRLTDPFGEVATALGCGLAMAAGFLVLLIPAGWPSLAAAMLLLGAGMAVGTSCLQSLISKIAPADAQGRVLGECESLLNIAGIGGPLAAGLAIEHLGPDWPYFVLSLITLGAVLLLRQRARHLLTILPPSTQMENG